MESNNSYIIVDDEEKAITLLRKSISKHFPALNCAGTYTSWEPALEAMRTTDFDLLFLDISMPGKTGMKLLEMVPELKSEIIFVTAYEEHALKAMNFSPTGYILKPVNDAKLAAAIDKALKRAHDKKLAERFVVEKLFHQKGKIGIRNKNGLDYIDVNDILFFQATSRYTRIITKDKEYLSSNNLGKFKSVVEQYDFYPVHRSYIINIRKVKRYESVGTVFMEGGYEIPVAKSSREAFLDLFDKI